MIRTTTVLQTSVKRYIVKYYHCRLNSSLIGRELDNRLEALEATKFIPTGFGDDAVGLEVGVEPWIDNLFLALPTLLNIAQVETIPTTVTEIMSSTKKEGPLFTSSENVSKLTELTLPQISSRFKDITIVFQEDNAEQIDVVIQKLPTMETEPCDARIVGLKRLTPIDEGDKIIVEAEIHCDTKFKFVPGDSFGFFPGNRDEEVNFILDCLDLKEKSDMLCQITCPPQLHIPKLSTPRALVKYCLELRSIPKKSFLRHLVDYCYDDQEKRRLLELSSREGAEDFSNCIRAFHTNILDILRHFPSCKPTLEVLLANIPPFCPRYYSVTNYCSDESDTFRIVFSVAKTHDGLRRTGSEKLGVFTGLVFKRLQEQEQLSSDTMEKRMANLQLNTDSLSMKVFKRKNPNFRLPTDPTIPLILVGPGTGVAPFIGFLEQRKHMRESLKRPLGQTWLFFGCRSPRETIYEEQLKQFEKERVLHRLKLSFSRESPSGITHYVQDEIKENSQEIYQQLTNKEVVIYVCGDMKAMSVQVFDAFVSVLEGAGQMMHENAVQTMRDMQSDKRYLQDIWT